MLRAQNWSKITLWGVLAFSVGISLVFASNAAIRDSVADLTQESVASLSLKGEKAAEAIFISTKNILEAPGEIGNLTEELADFTLLSAGKAAYSVQNSISAAIDSLYQAALGFPEAAFSFNRELKSGFSGLIKLSFRTLAEKIVELPVDIKSNFSKLSQKNEEIKVTFKETAQNAASGLSELPALAEEVVSDAFENKKRIDQSFKSGSENAFLQAKLLAPKLSRCGQEGKANLINLTTKVMPDFVFSMAVNLPKYLSNILLNSSELNELIFPE